MLYNQHWSISDVSLDICECLSHVVTFGHIGLSSANETLQIVLSGGMFHIGLKICSKRLHHLHDANGMMPTGCCRDTQTNSAGPEFNSALGQMTHRTMKRTFHTSHATHWQHSFLRSELPMASCHETLVASAAHCLLLIQAARSYPIDSCSFCFASASLSSFRFFQILQTSVFGPAKMGTSGTKVVLLLPSLGTAKHWEKYSDCFGYFGCVKHSKACSERSKACTHCIRAAPLLDSNCAKTICNFY